MINRRCLTLTVAATLVVLTAVGLPAAAAAAKPSANKKFCNAYKATAMYVQEQTTVSPSSAEAPALQAKIAASITKARGVVPAAIADNYAVATGDVTDLSAIFAALGAVDTWVLAHCNFKVVNVTTDGSTVKVPKTVKPGFVAFRVTNTGTASYFFGLVRRRPNETTAQLAATPINDFDRTRVITNVRADPGKPGVAYASVTKPGTYVILDGDTVGTPGATFATFAVKN